MKRNRAATQVTTRATTPHGRGTERHARRSEEVLIRSHDHQWAYDLDLEIRSDAGEVVFHDHYYVQPGHTESELNELPAGEYEIRATLDNSTRKTSRCRIGPGPEHTVLIEVGNGVLSITDGLNA